MKNTLSQAKHFIQTHKRILLIAGAILVVALVINSRTNSTAAPEEPAAKPVSVSVASVQTLQQDGVLELLGTVAPAEQAFVTSETSGRIQTIPATEGDVVSAGTVIASLNNTEQRIAVTQAQTSLQAARANSAQGDISVNEAQTRYDQSRQVLHNSIESSFTAAQRIIQENIDPHYSNPRSGAIGARVGKGAMVQTLNSKRVAIRNTMQNWENTTRSLAQVSDSELLAITNSSQQHVTEIISLLDDLIYAFQNEDSNSVYTAQTLQNLYTTSTLRKEDLLTLQNSLSSNQTNFTNAQSALAKAEIANDSEGFAGGNTQVAQAEASLASAQNRLAQTIFRAPIAGTIQDFSITLGEYITPGTQIATIANESAQEITTYVSEQERSRLQAGDTVLIDNTYEGTITRISPNIDRQSGKLAVTILTSDTQLTSGETVSVTTTGNTAPNSGTDDEDTVIRIPLTAILFDASGSNVLTVSEENTLQVVPVVLGETRGTTIEITEGIDADAEIVIDARGKKAGDLVSIESDS